MPYERTRPFKWSNILKHLELIKILWLRCLTIWKDERVHMANQNWLQSLQKMWNELFFMFLIYYCQRIQYKCIFYNDIYPSRKFWDSPSRTQTRIRGHETHPCKLHHCFWWSSCKSQSRILTSKKEFFNNYLFVFEGGICIHIVGS